MKRRRGLALVLLLLALGAWFALGRTSIQREPVALHFGATASEVRRAELHFERDGAMAGELTLSYPTGAPADAERDLRLHRGDYQVAVRLVYQRNGETREWHVTRPFTTGQPDPIDLERPR